MVSLVSFRRKSIREFRVPAQYLGIVGCFRSFLIDFLPINQLVKKVATDKKIMWKLSDSSNIAVGFFFMEDGKMKLMDLEGNLLEVPPETTLKQAIRIILNKQTMIC